jgi:hypothetical protein
MRKFLVSVALVSISHVARAQAPTIASLMEGQLSFLESQLVPAAEAMPADKYLYTPTAGAHEGVRTFALQVKHVATANLGFFSAILGEPLPPGVSIAGVANGPDSVRTKEQIIRYLKESFALGHRALATLTPDNAAEVLKNPPVPFMPTRLGTASFSCSHAWDHYGQIVEYLRANGIVPPASVGQPLANPPRRPS